MNRRTLLKALGATVATLSLPMPVRAIETTRGTWSHVLPRWCDKRPTVVDRPIWWERDYDYGNKSQMVLVFVDARGGLHVYDTGVRDLHPAKPKGWWHGMPYEQLAAIDRREKREAYQAIRAEIRAAGKAYVAQHPGIWGAGRA